MQLLKLVLENCVFTFQDKFFKQLHGAAMGSPCSPVVANIYIEYFKDLALGPDKFFKQLHGAAMGSPCSPVVANIYIEYFKDLALGPALGPTCTSQRLEKVHG